MYRLAPKFKLNSYYAGHIDKDSTAEIEILSGAYVDEAEALKEGVLDEAFFNGEDIDLSWRIVKGVGRIITFQTQIIHYKEKALRKEP